MVLCIPESTSAVVPDGGGNCINVSTALVGNFLRNPNLGWDIENTNLFALNANRVTITKKDLGLAMRIRNANRGHDPGKGKEAGNYVQ